MSAKDIKAKLDGKGLNQILDSDFNADAPGQVGFFRQVISTYFTSLGKADKRSCFAAAMKYAQTFDFAGLEGDKLVSAQKLLVQATKAWFHEALLGAGKFHGDTHAGNLMVTPGEITFIDFGNLYELKSDRPLLDDADEQLRHAVQYVRRFQDQAHGHTITSSELKAGWLAGEDTRVQAIKDDALKMAGDDSYQIDIGV